MNNKILAALALTTALVTGLQAQCQINSGAYVGLSLGGAHLGGDNKLEHDNDQNAGLDSVVNTRLSKTSFLGAIFGGYGMKFGNLWTAAELFYQFDNLQDKNKMRISTFNADKKIQSTSTGAFGASVHLGFSPNTNCVAYLIAGIEVRRFKVRFSDDARPRDIGAIVDKGYTSTAFAPGLGVQFAASKNIRFRTEYKCAIHPQKRLTDKRANTDIPGQTDTVTIKHRPQIHSFSVGLVYSF